MNLTMDATTLLATLGVVAGIGSFGIAIAKIRGRVVINNSNGKLNTGRVMTIVGDKLKEFWEGPCKSERDNREKMIAMNHESYKEELKADRDNQEKMLIIHQKMYRVELKAASDVLQGQVESIKAVLTDGFERIDIKIDKLNSKPKRGKKRSGD